MKTKKAKSTVIQHFWTWFTQHQEEICTPANGTNYISEFWEKECQLHIKGINRRLGFEIWYFPEINEHWLIVTAFGQAKYFPRVDALIEQAPYIKGWTFLALFPPAVPDFMLAQRHDLSQFNPLDLVFSPLLLEVMPGEDDMLVLYTNDERVVSDDDEEAVWDLLYNLVGERVLCNRYTSLLVMSTTHMEEELVAMMRPVTELVDYFPKHEISGLRIDSRGKINHTIHIKSYNKFPPHSQPEEEE